MFYLLVYRWTYADPSWARIAALVPVVVSCAEAGDEVANKILQDSVEELALSVKAVVQKLDLCGEGVVQLILWFGSDHYEIGIEGSLGLLTSKRLWLFWLK